MEYPEEVDFMVIECLHPEDDKLPEKPEDYYEIINEEAQPEIIKEEPHPAAHSLIHIADKNSQVAGDYSTQIIQEKPQVVGDFSTENAKKMLSYCMICDKNTDHDTFNCPDKETGFVWYDGVYMPNVCDLCDKTGHVGELCPVDADSDLDYDPPGPEIW